MNNIHEKDWESEDWGGYTGMDTSVFGEQNGQGKEENEGEEGKNGRE
ncbi:MAG: hypothetical protein ACLFQB_06995 [Chitinispirillaceae bacterium]